ncbi:MAG: ABC transporter ATP-binding protein/permease [Lachnospiraceae bacterium]|nr:ABC transporter ATP-binding protein/permease [Lachnospiraceae bacterium]
MEKIKVSEKKLSAREILRIGWKLAKVYWQSEEKVSAWLLLIAIIGMNLSMVYLSVQITHWYNDFYTLMQDGLYDSFYRVIGKFAIMAFAYIIIAVYVFYLRQLLTIKWRTWMTDKYLDRWMNNQVYYRMKVLDSDLDNPDQRIATDIGNFISYVMTIGIDLINQLVTLIAFISVLWNLSGVLDFSLFGKAMHIPGYMVYASLFYSILGTILVTVVGKKLVRLNFIQEKVEADFRFSMIRVRENAESIAFYNGEKPEIKNFKDAFSFVINNYRALMRQYLGLNYYMNGYGQLAIIFPMIMAAPQLFAGAMALGGFMEVTSAFGNVQDALSYIVTNFDSISDLIATVQRLGGFIDHIEEVEGLPQKFNEVPSNNEEVTFKNINVVLPGDRVILPDFNFNLKKGESLLIAGESGCGKSTLLRLLAGIWPYGEGEMQKPEEWKTLFLPQRPYLPLGTLISAIYYPQEVPEEISPEIIEMMERVGIDGLKDRLNDVDDWSRILSLGEQQRLQFLRIFLMKPDIIFLDESTSSLDEENEENAYRYLKERLGDAVIISVGHRKRLVEFHDRKITLKKGGIVEINK